MVAMVVVINIFKHPDDADGSKLTGVENMSALMAVATDAAALIYLIVIHFFELTSKPMGNSPGDDADVGSTGVTVKQKFPKGAGTCTLEIPRDHISGVAVEILPYLGMTRRSSGCRSRSFPNLSVGDCTGVPGRHPLLRVYIKADGEFARRWQLSVSFG
ncbi:MAG: hypothetical protein Q9171_005295 [Xanthocarpia ochracea]